MLRTSIYMALIAMACLVRLSDAANCTLSSFKQDFSAIQLSAAKIIAEEYASATNEQIVAQILDLYKESIVYVDFKKTQNNDTVTIDYKIIFACNDTTTSTMPDGSTKTTETKSQVDKSQVEKTVSAGLFLQLDSRSSDTIARVSSLQVSTIEPFKSLRKLNKSSSVPMIPLAISISAVIKSSNGSLRQRPRHTIQLSAPVHSSPKLFFIRHLQPSSAHNSVQPIRPIYPMWPSSHVRRAKRPVDISWPSGLSSVDRSRTPTSVPQLRRTFKPSTTQPSRNTLPQLVSRSLFRRQLNLLHPLRSAALPRKLSWHDQQTLRNLWILALKWSWRKCRHQVMTKETLDVHI